MLFSSLLVIAAISFNSAAADPSPPPSWGGVTVIEVSTCKCHCCCVTPQTTKEKVVVAPVEIPKVATPVNHYLKDNSGKTWFHTDKVWLEQHVRAVNAKIAQDAQRLFYWVAPQAGSACANGQCSAR